jgi:hypothetical protein
MTRSRMQDRECKSAGHYAEVAKLTNRLSARRIPDHWESPQRPRTAEAMKPQVRPTFRGPAVARPVVSPGMNPSVSCCGRTVSPARGPHKHESRVRPGFGDAERDPRAGPPRTGILRRWRPSSCPFRPAARLASSAVRRGAHRPVPPHNFDAITRSVH